MGVLSDRMKQVSSIDIGRGIQNVLSEARAILDNPLALFNTEYSLLAYTSVISKDPIWNELITNGTFSYDTQVLFMEEGFIDSVASAESVVLLSSDKLEYDRILGKIYNENRIHVANLIITASARPFNDDDSIVFEAVCKLVSEEIIRSGFYHTYGRIYQETYIRKLIDGEITDKALFAAHIAIVYSGYKSSMRLAIADIGTFNPDEYSKLSYFRDLFGQTEDNLEYAIYSKYILIIIGSDDSEFEARKDFGKLYELFMQNKIYVGVSSNFDNLYELRKYYLEATDALNRGLIENSGEWCFIYE